MPNYIYEGPTDYQQVLTSQQLRDTLAQSGLSQQDQDAVAKSYQQQIQTPAGAPVNPPKSTSAPGPVQNPGWIYAVNMPSTYPDFAAMAQSGTGIVISSDDPNAQLLLDAARQWGIPVAIQVNAPPGISPQEYASRVAAAQQLAPDKLVLDIESVGKGYEGSAGWQWSQQAAALLKPVVGDTQVAVTMEPNQADYNYNAYVGLSGGGNTQFWVQSYTGDMTGVPPEYATAPAIQAVGANNVIAILGPNQAPTSGGMYVSYGIPQTGATSAGVYGGGAPRTSSGGYGIPGATTTSGPGGSPGVVQDPPSGVPNPTTTAAGGSTGSAAGDWAKAYFGNLGLPPDVQEAITGFFTKYPDDPQLAIELSKQYIRTTPWFAQNFPGFFEGIKTGLFTDETGYRGYVNQANVYSMQYFNRPISVMEIESALHQGLSPEYLGKTFEAGSIAVAQGADFRYALGAFGESDVAQQARDDPSRVAYDIGREQAGLGSVAGARLQAALDRANKRMQAIFGGQLSIPNTTGQALQPSSHPDISA